jgi:hypothetical protein
VAVVNDPIGDITRAALKARRDCADGLSAGESCRCRRKQNRAGIEMRQPNDRCLISSQIRIDRETATPNAASTLREIPSAAQQHRLSLDNRDDSRDCAAKIPKPAR